jgi:hypothetical protein
MSDHDMVTLAGCRVQSEKCSERDPSELLRVDQIGKTLRRFHVEIHQRRAQGFAVRIECK